MNGTNDDFILKVLVGMAQAGTQMPITIIVGGTLLEGDMIGEAEFFEETAARLTSAGREQQRRFQELIGGLPATMDAAAMEGIDEGVEPEEMRKLREDVATSFIHLRNIRVFSAGSFTALTGGTWRGRVSSVDGFLLGRSAW
jgi:hypothetical protein